MPPYNQPLTKDAVKPSEDTIQSQAVTIFRLTYPRYARRLIHIPNGGKRSGREAAKFKRLGVIAGACDLVLFIPRQGKGGLLIEVKDHKGRVSAAQAEFMTDLSLDYAVAVCRSVDEILTTISAYLGERPNKFR